MRLLTKVLIILSLLPTFTVMSASPSVADTAVAGENLALDLVPTCRHRNTFLGDVESTKAVDSDVSSFPAAVVASSTEHTIDMGCAVFLDASHEIGTIQVSVGEKPGSCWCYYDVFIDMAGGSAAPHRTLVKRVQSLDAGQDYVTFTAGTDWPNDGGTYSQITAEVRMSESSRCYCEQGFTFGIRDLRIVEPTLVPSPYSQAVENRTAATAAVGAVVYDGIIGTAEPVLDPTERQLDAVEATTGAVLDAMPQEQVQLLGEQTATAIELLETTVLEPTDRQIFTAVEPNVRRITSALRIPYPGSSGYASSAYGVVPSTPELKVCGRDPFDCARATKARFDAKGETIRRYGKDGAGDPSDAFRHCYWQALTTKRANRDFAEKIAAAHEAGNPHNTRRSRLMDEHNNRIGRDVGATKLRDTKLSSECSTKQRYGRKLRATETPSGPNLVWLVS